MTTNERFDEQFVDIFGRWKWLDLSKEEQVAEIKTFISTEKNLLLDQAIEELMNMREEGRVGSHWVMDGTKMIDRFDQYISKLKELKE
jgi:hypothetical protein